MPMLLGHGSHSNGRAGGYAVLCICIAQARLAAAPLELQGAVGAGDNVHLEWVKLACWEARGRARGRAVIGAGQSPSDEGTAKRRGEITHCWSQKHALQAMQQRRAATLEPRPARHWQRAPPATRHCCSALSPLTDLTGALPMGSQKPWQGDMLGKHW